jgi:penicillin-binding protein 1A
MNVPSIRILNRLGFDAAIQYSSTMLGIPERDQIQRNFARGYPLGLGVISTSPIEMAKAFATFPNQGKEVIPIAIQYVEDRFGKIIAEPEKDLRVAQARRSREAQIISPQTAYIMTNILEDTVDYGTLRYPRGLVGDFDLPTAGKTGTTQNWTNAWTVGFTPYYTTAVWIGFDSGAQSLGVNQTGAITAGPIWARYMKAIHQDLPWRDFVKPNSGITEMEVTRANGLIPPSGYQGEVYTEVFRTGTQPTDFDFTQEYLQEQQSTVLSRLETRLVGGSAGTSPLIISSNLQDATRDLLTEVDLSLTLDAGVEEIINSVESGNNSDSSNNPPTIMDTNNPFGEDPTIFDGNPLLDENTSSTDLVNPYLD